MDRKFYIKAILPYSEDPDVYKVYLANHEKSLLVPVEVTRKAAEGLLLAQQEQEAVRPHTHDTIKRIVLSLGGEVTRVLVNLYQDDIFYAYIDVTHDKKMYEIDSKITDALAVAIRFNVPIFIADRVLEALGVKVKLLRDG